MTIVLTPAEVRRLLPMDECMTRMDEALRTLDRGEALNPLRSMLRIPDRGVLGLMPGWLGSPGALGLKVVAVFPGNHGTEYDAHQGVVVLFDNDNGVPLAILDASEVTAIRTAATTGVATRLLAREDSRILAILGTGVQARTHLEALLLARPFDEIRVFSRSAEKREAFAARESKRHGRRVVAAASPRECVAGADVICTTTSSAEPVLLGEWLTPGMHVNAVGASLASARELDSAAVARSRMFVDRRESTENESGAYRTALAEGAIGEGHIVGEIGAVLDGNVEGRRSAEEITLFKSLGLAVEDLAAAHHVWRRAVEEEVGTRVELGGVAG